MIDEPVLLEELSRIPSFGAWEPSSEYFAEQTHLGTFPPITLASGTVLFAALEPSARSSVILLRLPDAIKADAETRDALAVACPAALSDSWGVDFRTIRAELDRRSGKRLMSVKGTVDTEPDQKVALITWVPDRRGHFVIIAVTPPKEAAYLTEVARVAMRPLMSDHRGIRTDNVLRVGLAVSLTLALVLVLALRAASKRAERGRRKID